MDDLSDKLDQIDFVDEELTVFQDSDNISFDYNSGFNLWFNEYPEDEDYSNQASELKEYIDDIVVEFESVFSSTVTSIQ